MLENFENPAQGAEKLKSYEHIDDDLTHAIVMRLNQTFITPFDREDIHELASAIDDVVTVSVSSAMHQTRAALSLNRSASYNISRA